MLVHSGEGGSQDKMCAACLKDEGEGFRLPKCIVHTRERWRSQGILFKAEV